MKNAFLLFACILFSLNIIHAQNLVLESASCYSIRLNQKIDKHQESRFLLREKELVQNIWVKVSSKTTKENFEFFSDLENGTYRVTSIRKKHGKAYSNSVVINCEQKKVAKEKLFSVYPNPAIDEFQLRIEQFNDHSYAFHIYSITGKLLKAGQLLSKESSISLEGFSAGLYLLNVYERGRFLGRSKLIIQ